MNMLIALPAYPGEIKIECTASLMSASYALARRGIPITIITAELSDIAVARNALASYFINQTQCTHMLMIDRDMMFHPSAIMKLVDADKNIVGCAAPLRGTGSGQPIYNIRISDGENRIERGLMNVPRLGTGIILISRRCLEAMLATGKVRVNEHDELRFHGDTKPLYGFFDRLHRGNTIVQEDFSFCLRWQELCGGEIYALTDEEIGHVDKAVVQGRFIDTARAALKAEPAS